MKSLATVKTRKISYAKASEIINESEYFSRKNNKVFGTYWNIDYNVLEGLAYKKAIGHVVPYQSITNCISWVSRFKPEYADARNEATRCFDFLMRQYAMDHRVF